MRNVDSKKNRMEGITILTVEHVFLQVTKAVRALHFLICGNQLCAFHILLT